MTNVRPLAADASRRRDRRAYTLVEVMIVATIMGILAVIPIPLFARAIEQSKLDLAASNLRAVWSAERYFYLENGRYGSIADLSTSPDASGSGLLDPSIASGTTYYGYTIDVADGQSFSATALHPPGGPCAGSVTIDQAGTLSCEVTYSTSAGATPMAPSLGPQG